MVKTTTRTVPTYGWTDAQLSKLKSVVEQTGESMSEFIRQATLTKLHRIKVNEAEIVSRGTPARHVKKSTDSGAKKAAFIETHKTRLKSMYENYRSENPDSENSFEEFADMIYANGRELVAT